MSERIDDPTFKANGYDSAQNDNFSFASHIYHTTNNENLLFSPDKVNPFQKHFNPASTDQAAQAQNQGGATVDQNRQRQYEKEWEQYRKSGVVPGAPLEEPTIDPIDILAAGGFGGGSLVKRGGRMILETGRELAKEGIDAVKKIM